MALSETSVVGIFCLLLHILSAVHCELFESMKENFSDKVSIISNSGTLQHSPRVYSYKVDQRSNVSFNERSLSEHSSLNAIDSCWRGNFRWAKQRKQLADCAIGFGSQTVGGKYGEFYVVTDPSDDPISPKRGTLRYGVIQLVPLWIVFARSMTITLQNELIVTSSKTIDGRGENVHIAHGPCITIQNVENVILHGLHIHDCKPGRPGNVRSSTAHLGYRRGSDGDGISVLASKNIWIDHNSLASCSDGLIDVILASTAITISNNVFANHDKAMLLGHNDAYTADRIMKVTVAFNRFGPGLQQRMPRCRFGYFHVVNNDYYEWGMYAIGGSANPTIISSGNRYHASNAKQVTKRNCASGSYAWKGWKWRSMEDTFLNGAYFVESGARGASNSVSANELVAAKAFTPSMTWAAGALSCSYISPC